MDSTPAKSKTGIYIALLVVFVIVIVVGGIYSSTRSPQLPSNSTATNSNPAVKPSDMENTSPGQTGRYLEFSLDSFALISSPRRVLFFYASWCPTCRPADTSFSQNQSRIPEDVTIIRVNYNDPQTDQAEKDLALKYKITYQHTFVQIDAEGNIVSTWNGGQIDQLLAKII